MTEYGICQLSVVPLRAEPTDKAEIKSQLFFGESLQVLKHSENGKWSYVKNAYDGYEGWIDPKQYIPVSREYFDKGNKPGHALAADLVGILKGSGRSIPLLFGAVLPFYKDGLVRINDETFQYDGNIIVPVRSNDFGFLQKIAFNYLHAPYLWGGKSHFGIDCSGFVQQVFRFSGYSLPRDAYQQAEYGLNVPFGELNPGDLAFFKDDLGTVIHVGIILENGLLIHASGQVRIDILDEKGIFNTDRKFYSHKFHSIRRVFS